MESQNDLYDVLIIGAGSSTGASFRPEKKRPKWRFESDADQSPISTAW